MPDQSLLTPDEAARRLSISPITMKDWLRKGKFPGLKVGNQWRVRESDLPIKSQKNPKHEEVHHENISMKNLATKLVDSGYSASETADILSIVLDGLKNPIK